MKVTVGPGSTLPGVGEISAASASPVPEARSQASDRYPAVEKPVADSLAASLATNAAVPATIPRPLQVLVLTGGVDGAPYASGVLVGWSESGTRPTFEAIQVVASAAYKGARPLDNTDLNYAWRKKMARVYVERALSRVCGLDDG